MQIVFDDGDLDAYMSEATRVSPDRPVLVDKFLEDAIEVDVDAVADGTRCVIGGIMEQLELAGIHSGDSSCVIPPYSLSDSITERLAELTRQFAVELNVRGLMNVQWAVKDAEIHVIEVNPRASRTVPFISKAVGVPLARIAARVMAGESLADVGFVREVVPDHTAVKQPVFPFSKFPESDIILGPEMRSTGESIGIDPHIGSAYAKAYEATGHRLPLKGTVFVSVKDADKRKIISLADRLIALGFSIVSTRGTSKILTRNGIENELILKIAEGRPNVADLLKNGQIDLVINTPSGGGPRTDEAKIRRLAISQGISCITTLAAAELAIRAIEARRRMGIRVAALQEYAAGTLPF